MSPLRPQSTSQAQRIVESLAKLGEALPPRSVSLLAQAANERDPARAERLIQQALDPLCLIVVEINPEARVKARRGPARPALIAQAWRTFVVRIDNQAGITTTLKASSPNAPVGEGRDRWLDLKLEHPLSGGARDWAILQLYSRDRGAREATLSFHAGQGTQDLGFRSDVDLLFQSAPPRAELRLHRVFSDHMVLQRDRPLTVWGSAEPGETIRVAFAGTSAVAAADRSGHWKATLPPPRLNREPQTLTVEGRTTQTLQDILVGDVWLCSGQSNMAFGLGSCNAPDDIRTADLSLVRFRGYWERFSGTPQDDLPPGTTWQRVTPESVGGCTAVGFYFARRVARETGVPIGLLESTVGGTEIECWMPPQAFRDYPENAPIGRALEAAVAAWRKELPAALETLEGWIAASRRALADGRPVPPRPAIPGHPNEDRDRWVRTQSLYNGMIHPLLPLAIKGALWYQGENNGGEGASYVAKQRALVETWRKLWGYEFPFYYVQLANWLAPTDDPAGGDGWARGRMAQLQCLDVLPRVGMAVTIDVGDADDIHPKNKRAVGERLALWALARDYGKSGLTVTGPLYRGMTVEGDRVRIAFQPHSIGGGLEARGGPLRRFAIAGAEGTWRWADAAIDGDSVLVSSPRVPKPVAVRYAYAMNPAGANLYNRDGLPASPFRTDPG